LLAFSDEGASKPSEILECRTLCDVPAKPGTPKVKGKILAQSFRLYWDIPTNDGGVPPTSYHLELDSGSGGFQVVYSGPDTEHICDRLAPGTMYKCRVKCQGPGGMSDYSELAQVATLPVCPGACAPPKVVGKPKANSISLKWGTFLNVQLSRPLF
jgi:hypothetical protein